MHDSDKVWATMWVVIVAILMGGLTYWVQYTSSTIHDEKMAITEAGGQLLCTTDTGAKYVFFPANRRP